MLIFYLVYFHISYKHVFVKLILKIEFADSFPKIIDSGTSVSIRLIVL